MPTLTQTRGVLLAAAIAITLAYLAGGAQGIGAGDRDYVFSPAVDPEVQRAIADGDVPLGAPPTLSALTARASLAVALGRRSALRDFAAVSAALAAVAFAACLLAAGLPAIAVTTAMLGLSLGETFWWRGVSYANDALFPALALLAIWAALHWRAHSRRSMAVIAFAAAIAAAADCMVPLMARSLGTPEPPPFLGALTKEFTALGFFLGLIGFAVLAQSPVTRIPAAIVAVVLLAWHAVARSAIDPVSVPLVLAGWYAIAVAIARLHSSTPPPARHLLVAAVAVVLIATPALTRWRLSGLGKDVASEQRARMAGEFRPGDASEGVMVMAESRRSDAAIMLTSRLAGSPITIVPQSPDHVAEALQTRRPLLAFANAERHLGQLGFLFERAIVGNVVMATVAGRVPCATLNADTFEDVSLLLANGSFVIHGPPNAAPAGIVIRMSSAAPTGVAAIEPRSIPYELGAVAADAEGVPALLEVAGGRDAGAIASMRIPATGRVSPVAVTFTNPPAYAVATSEEPTPVSICPGLPRSGITLGAAADASATLRMNDNAPFGSGWHPVEADPDYFRWTGAPDASVRISVARPSPVFVTITATPAARPEQNPTIAMTVNGCRLESRTMQSGQGDYSWEVGERCWRPGVNQLWIHTSPLISPASLFATHDTRLLGARVGAIRLARR